MSKFCGNCGTVMDDAAVVCGNCGTPLAVAPAPAEEKKASKFNAGAITGVIDGVKKGDKGALVKGGIAVAAVAVVLILIISIFSGGGEEKAAKKLIKAFDKEKPESIVKLLPKFCLGDTENGDEMSEDEWEEEFEEQIEYLNERLDEEYGIDEYSIKYELLYTDEYGKDYLKDIEEDLEDYEDFDDSKLKAATDLVYEVTYKGKGEKVVSKASITVIKYGSKWYVYDFSFGTSSVVNDEKPEYSW